MTQRPQRTIAQQRQLARLNIARDLLSRQAEGWSDAQVQERKMALLTQLNERIPPDEESLLIESSDGLDATD